jgi:hypothetical protein
VRRSVLGAVALAGLFAIAGYYAAWHGDALEVYRHALSAAVELRLTLWIVTALTIDALVARRVGSAIGVPGEAHLDREEQRGAPGDDQQHGETGAAAGRGEHAR